MMKLTVLYGPPADPAGFEEHYESTHLPLVAQVPNLRRFEAGKTATADGTEPPYYRIAELWFDGPEEMQESLSSPEGQAATGDIPNFATGGATVFVSVVEEPLEL
jgi:uncharacterized protein (TIGR02118 family)